MAEPTHQDSVKSNGRYGGGSGGPETRHHNPAADTQRFHEAKEGATVKAAKHGDMPARVPEAKLNTVDGPGRGAVAGKALPSDRGGF